MKKVVISLFLLSWASAWTFAAVDTTPPTVQWTLPQNPRPRQTVRGIKAFNVEATDNVGIKQVRMKRPQGGADLVMTPAGANSYYAIFDTRALSNGQQTFVAYAIDTSGLISVEVASVTINVDNMAPSILFSAFDGERISESREISASVSDTSGVDDFRMEFPTSLTSFSTLRDKADDGILSSYFNLNSLPVGDYKIVARAKDTVDNSNTATIFLKAAKNCAPIAEPIVVAATSFNPALLSFRGIDVEGDRLEYLPVTAPSHGKISWDGTAFLYLPDEAYQGEDYFEYEVRDGNQASPRAGIYVSVNTPGAVIETVADDILSVAISSPTDSTVVDYVIIQASVAVSSPRTVSMVAIYFDEKLISTLLAPPYASPLKLKGNQLGDHTIRVEAVDSEGHHKSASKTISVLPAEPPFKAEIVGPQGPVIRGTVDTRIYLTNASSIFTSVRLFQQNNQLTVFSSEMGYRGTWDTRSIAYQSQIELRAELRDVNGVFLTTSTYVDVDNTPPTVDFTDETKETVKRSISQEIVITASPSDVGQIDRVEFRANGNLLATSVDAVSPSFVLEPQNFSNGLLAISAQAFDTAGNPSIPATLTVTINNTTGVIVTEHPLHGGYAAKDDDAQIFVEFSDDVVPVNGGFDDVISVGYEKDGHAYDVSGKASYRNRVLTFTPDNPIPKNSKVRWRMRDLKDGVGNPIGSSEFVFVRPFSPEEGGTLSMDFSEQTNVQLTFPPNVLPTPLWIDLQQIPSTLSAAASENPDIKQVVPPFSIVGQDADGHFAPTLAAPALLTYTDRRPPAEADEQSRVVQFESFDGHSWRPVSTKQNGVEPSSAPGMRTVTVPITRFGTYRVTSVTVTGEGVTDFFNYPNPFSPVETGTWFHYVLGEESEVTLVIYDLFGNLVKKITAHPGETCALKGQNKCPWDGRNGEGTLVANGGYLVQITAEDSEGRKTTGKHKVGVVK